MKTLLIDIESAPSLAYVWDYFKANINPNQVLDNGYIISYAAKWLDKEEIIYSDNRKFNDTSIVAEIIGLLDEADVVIAHNALKFDIPTINARAVVAGLKPPSPYKIIDTLQVAKKEFRFKKNSLEHISNQLKCTPKGGHKKFPGFELWLECLRNNDEAWQELMEYNVQDVKTLEEVYLKLRPWIKNHPNVGVYKESDKSVCPVCGSDHHHFRGYYHTRVGKYRRFRCLDCGHWGRSRYTEYPKHKLKDLIVSAN